MSQHWKPILYLLLAFGALLFGPPIVERLIVGFEGGSIRILVQEQFYLMLLNLIAPLFLVVIFVPLYQTHKTIIVFPMLWIAILVLGHKLNRILFLSYTQEGQWLYAIIIFITGLAAALALWKTSTETDQVDLRQSLRIVMGFILFTVSVFNPIFLWEYNTWFARNDLVVLYAIVNIAYTFGFYLVTGLLVQQLFATTKERNTAQQ